MTPHPGRINPYLPWVQLNRPNHSEVQSICAARSCGAAIVDDSVTSKTSRLERPADTRVPPYGALPIDTLV